MAQRGNLLTIGSGTGDKMTRKALKARVWAREATTAHELRSCPVSAHLPGPVAAPAASRGTRRPWAAAATRPGRARRPALLSAPWSTPWLRTAGPRRPNRNRNRSAQAGSHPTRGLNGRRRARDKTRAPPTLLSAPGRCKTTTSFCLLARLPASSCRPGPGILAPKSGSFALLSIPAHHPTLNPFLLCVRNSFS